MAEVTGPELAFRLFVAGTTILGPTVLYLGLWRFLEWLRDDELVEHLAAQGVIEHPQTTEQALETVAGTGSAPRRCTHCGARNASWASACRNCSTSLE